MSICFENAEFEEKEGYSERTDLESFRQRLGLDSVWLANWLWVSWAEAELWFVVLAPLCDANTLITVEVQKCLSQARKRWFQSPLIRNDTFCWDWLKTENEWNYSKREFTIKPKEYKSIRNERSVSKEEKNEWPADCGNQDSVTANEETASKRGGSRQHLRWDGAD